MYKSHNPELAICPNFLQLLASSFKGCVHFCKTTRTIYSHFSAALKYKMNLKLNQFCSLRATKSFACEVFFSVLYMSPVSHEYIFKDQWKNYRKKVKIGTANPSLPPVSSLQE